MKLENREKDLQEYKQKELLYKKRIMELESRSSDLKYSYTDEFLKNNQESKVANI